MKGYHIRQFKDELARYPKPEAEGDGYNGYIGYTIDNKNNDVTEVTDVTTPHPQLEADVGDTPGIPHPTYGSDQFDDFRLPGQPSSQEGSHEHEC